MNAKRIMMVLAILVAVTLATTLAVAQAPAGGQGGAGGRGGAPGGAPGGAGGGAPGGGRAGDLSVAAAGASPCTTASLEDRWRSPARRQRSGPVLFAARVRSARVTVTDRRLPSCVARMWHGWLA